MDCMIPGGYVGKCLFYNPGTPSLYMLYVIAGNTSQFVCWDVYIHRVGVLNNTHFGSYFFVGDCILYTKHYLERCIL